VAHPVPRSEVAQALVLSALGDGWPEARVDPRRVLGQGAFVRGPRRGEAR